MALRLGKYESVDVAVRTSVIESRKLFLELLVKTKPEVSSDLMRLYNVESIPDEADAIDFSAKFFLLHTKDQNLYQLELSKFNFKENVRDTPLLAFYDFLFKNQQVIDALAEKHKLKWEVHNPHTAPNLIIASAIDEFIPDWEELQSKENSEWVCTELRKWAEKWNLKDDWCLDFALDCLKDFKENFTDKLTFPDDYAEYVKNNIYGYNELYDLRSYWRNGRAWLNCLTKLIWQKMRNHLALTEFSNYPLFEYEWKTRTEKGLETCFKVEGLYNPLANKPEDFREAIEKDFWNKFFGYFSNRRDSFVGDKSKLTIELNKFERKVAAYIEKADNLVKSKAKATLQKRSGEKHFQWLIEYQILGKSFNELSQEKDFNRKAITDGIRDVAKIIGLTLRKYTPQGRKIGAKDKGVRQYRRERNN